MPTRRLVPIAIVASLCFLFPHPGRGEQARTLPLEVLQSRAPASVAYTEETVPLRLLSGTTIEARIRTPRGWLLRKGRLPAVMVFGGFEEAEKVLSLIETREQCVLASFNYPFSPPRRFSFPESLQHGPKARQAILDTIAGIEALVEELTTRREVDPDRISVLGASFGAPFAIIAAGSLPQISGVVLVHGFANVPSTLQHLLARKWHDRLGFLSEPFAALVTRVGWWYLRAPDPQEFIPRFSAGQKVLLIAATGDTFVAHDQTESLWEAIRSSRATGERIDLPGDHLQPGAHDQLSEITAKVTEWLRRSSLL